MRSTLSGPWREEAEVTVHPRRRSDVNLDLKALGSRLTVCVTSIRVSLSCITLDQQALRTIRSSKRTLNDRLACAVTSPSLAMDARSAANRDLAQTVGVWAMEPRRKGRFADAMAVEEPRPFAAEEHRMAGNHAASAEEPAASLNLDALGAEKDEHPAVLFEPSATLVPIRSRVARSFSEKSQLSAAVLEVETVLVR